MLKKVCDQQMNYLQSLLPIKNNNFNREPVWQDSRANNSEILCSHGTFK